MRTPLLAGVLTCTFFLLHSFQSLSQSGYNLRMVADYPEYRSTWRDIDSLARYGLNRQAAQMTDSLFQVAAAAGNHPQMVRAAMYHSTQLARYAEEPVLENLATLRSRKDAMTGPSRAFWHLLMARAYRGYQDMYGYRQQQTELMEDADQGDDIREWSSDRLDREVDAHLDRVLELNEIRYIPVQEYSPVIQLHELASRQRPSLFDFLAHEVIQMWGRQTYYWWDGGNTQVKDIDKLDLYAQPQTFGAWENATRDSSDKGKTYRLYQELTRMHLQDKDPMALAHVTLERLTFVKGLDDRENKEELHLAALEKFESDILDPTTKRLVMMGTASQLETMAAQYSYGAKPEYKDYYIRAERKLKTVKEQATDTLRRNEAINRLNSINSEHLSVSLPQAMMPGQEHLYQMEYRNVAKVHFKLIPMDHSSYIRLSDKRTEDIVKKLAAMGGKTWSQDLTESKDHQHHRVELVLPPTDLGHYVLVASMKSDFSTDMNVVCVAPYWSTRIHVAHVTNEDGLDILTSNSANGEPLQGARVKLFQRRYDYRQGRYEFDHVTTLTSDQNGISSYGGYDSHSFGVEVTHGNDQFHSGSTGYIYHYRYKRKKTEQEDWRVSLFTDRGIYRPGQEVHFKAIFFRQTPNGPELRTGLHRKVRLYDYNYQVVDSLELVSNDFGSVSGTFKLPTSVVTGNFRIQIDEESASKYLRVEEYKRPKFFVEIEQNKDQIRLEDSVKMTGYAKGYAGNRLSGAEVSYTVRRSVSYPYWWYWRGWYPSYSNDIIATGDTLTGDDGSFPILFVASRDEDVDRGKQPTYTYTIQATVTDINGETHQAVSYVYAGERGFNLSADLGGQVMRSGDSLNAHIWARNLNGSELEVEGEYIIHRIAPEKSFLRDRLWQNPDVFILSESDHAKRFPMDRYSDSTVVQLMDRPRTKVKTGTFTTDTAKREIELAGISTWKPGEYMLEMKSTDRFGNEIRDYQVFVILDKESHAPVTTEALYTYEVTRPEKPGETLELLVGSVIPDAHVLVEISYGKKVLQRKWLLLDSAQRLFTFQVPENGYGNYSISLSTSLVERSFSQSTNFSIWREYAYLDVKLSSFRNKVYPNSEEEWTLTVKDHKKQPVEAEALAAMYDASLDEFAGNWWGLNFFEDPYSSRYWQNSVGAGLGYGNTYNYMHRTYRQTWSLQNTFMPFLGGGRYGGYRGYYQRLDDVYGEDSIDATGAKVTTGWDYDKSLEGGFAVRGARRESAKQDALYSYSAMVATEEVMDEAEAESMPNAPMGGSGKLVAQMDSNNGSYADGDGKDAGVTRNAEQTIDLASVQARKNFSETAFFLPQLTTNDKGETQVKFTMPESLTKWKFMALAHTKQMQQGSTQETVHTQKDLMVFTNVPRFLRTGDRIRLTARLSSLVSDKTQKGVARLEILDARTEQPISEAWARFEDKPFELKPNGNGQVNWMLDVPMDREAIIIKVVAGTGEFSDGEQHLIPVLNNKVMVTESLPFTMHGKGKQEVHYDRMKELLAEGVQAESATLEFTANPAWYAVQSLPYIMEYPHECSEQIFSRFYANTLATFIVAKQPRIQEVFKKWEKETPETFLSNLEKNQELKQILLEESPWVLQAKDEEERKRRVALLFDMHRMQREGDKALDKLKDKQVYGGAWPWFKGMPPSEYITRHIVAGVGHLKHLGAIEHMDYNVRNMMQSAVRYLDKEIVEDHEYWKKYHGKDTGKYISYYHLHYLYARSFFPEFSLDKKTQEAHDWLMAQGKKHWQDLELYSQGMMALVAERKGEEDLAERVTASLTDRAIRDEEKGTYWADNRSGWYWYQAPIETQAILIEAFVEVEQDTTMVDAMKRWLLSQKRTNEWHSTKATAEACYALLLQGTDLIALDGLPRIVWGGDLITDKGPEAAGRIVVEPIPGAGYFKTSKEGDEVEAADADLVVERTDRGTSWGALYFQYFQEADKVTLSDSPLKVERELYTVVVDGEKEKLARLEDGNTAKVGDRIRVRLVLETDRDMEYIHLKDMRSASLEPVEQVSGHRYQNGLWYYQSMRDASANFFFERITPGRYVFEYDLFVEQEGEFSNGFANVQCMYAPEFGAHSKGMRLKVAK